MNRFSRPAAWRCYVLMLASFAAVPAARADTPESREPQASPVELVVWQRSGFEGRIGDEPVRVTFLRRIGDDVDGRYCSGACEPQSDTLLLSGTWRDGGLSLDASTLDATGKPRTTGHWRLQPEGSGWRGEWRSADGQRALPATLTAVDADISPYELRVLADFLPGTSDEDSCDAQSPPVSEIRVYRDGALLQTLETATVGTCSMFVPQQIDMDFDGHPDITIALTQPAGPNVPQQSWLFDPRAGRYVDAPASLQHLTSPEFDPEHRIVYSFWRGSCCSHGVDTYRWKDGDLEAVDRQESHQVPVLRAGKLGYLYSVPRYVDGAIVYSPRVVRRQDGTLMLEGADAASLKLEDGPFFWNESLAVDVYAVDAAGASRRERVETMRWRRIKDAAGLRWCPDLAAYDIDRHRIVRQRVDTPESCTDTAPGG